MLMKLLKYEFRSIGRQLIPLYLGILGLAFVNHFLWFGSPSNRGGVNQALAGIPAIAVMIAYIAVFVALAVITLLLIVQRFYKGLLTEEGYLMFTLPCKTWQLIAAKGITASAMTIIGSGVGILSLMLMGLRLSDWGDLFLGLFKIPWGRLFQLHALWPLYIVEAIVLAMVGIFGSIGHVYVSIAIGHLFHRHRVMFAIIAYIAINIAGSVLFVSLIRLSNAIRFDWTPLEIWLSDSANGPWALHLMLLILIVGSAIPAAVYFFGTNWILSRKLNLE